VNTAGLWFEKCVDNSPKYDDDGVLVGHFKDDRDALCMHKNGIEA
jgi:hypothetical protein